MDTSWNVTVWLHCIKLSVSLDVFCHIIICVLCSVSVTPNKVVKNNRSCLLCVWGSLLSLLVEFSWTVQPWIFQNYKITLKFIFMFTLHFVYFFFWSSIVSFYFLWSVTCFLYFANWLVYFWHIMSKWESLADCEIKNFFSPYNILQYTFHAHCRNKFTGAS